MHMVDRHPDQPQRARAMRTAIIVVGVAVAFYVGVYIVAWLLAP
ncbi:MAG TPA: hypothetical protein VFM97_12010 [Gammaproteobacteria bacterium]|nr:hypothetical protein [Gammaproteobacteria bacterium]